MIKMSSWHFTSKWSHDWGREGDTRLTETIGPSLLAGWTCVWRILISEFAAYINIWSNLVIHKPFDFVDIKPQVIVVPPCDRALIWVRTDPVTARFTGVGTQLWVWATFVLKLFSHPLSWNRKCRCCYPAHCCLSPSSSGPSTWVHLDLVRLPVRCHQPRHPS